MKVNNIETDLKLLAEVMGLIRECVFKKGSVVILRRPKYSKYSVNDYINTGLVREVIPLVSKNYTLNAVNPDTGETVMLSELVPTNAGLHLHNILHIWFCHDDEVYVKDMLKILTGLAY